MAGPTPQPETNEGRAGLIAGLTAYTIWGLFPIYFVATKHVPALEILAHRIVWSLPFGLLILLFRKQIAETIKALVTPKTVILLAIAAIALAINWGVYIWAIQQEQIFQGSLGYYINPLLYVLVGVLFFKEKLSALQGLAITFACIGVAILTFKGGVFPAISLILAVTFTTYGVLRKYIVVGAMPGLFIEVTVLLLPAIGTLYYLSQQNGLAWNNAGLETDILLVLAGPLTVLPLLAFAFAARRIKLSTLGILQYLGPTMQFGCALYFGEPFTLAHALCFGFIWLGVGVFAYDAIRSSRRQVRPVSR
ncbi:EamA family transporter RarD [Litorimonas sp. WD9-15]|uniref:EamA family transporter RarD n=1 Tax=Litorimonas sp. WD9-15 TaxID=3418716 RepID=UPI003D0791C1